MKPLTGLHSQRRDQYAFTPSFLHRHEVRADPIHPQWPRLTPPRSTASSLNLERTISDLSSL